ncbi:mycoredoxin [Micrococcales bacterium 31B]|nr:mycoredoxin [Micrococcales bacterium 31B]
MSVQVPAGALPETGSVTMFSTTWCSYCKRLKNMMDHEGIAYSVIDIEDKPEFADFVGEVNGGNHVVPTLVFPDGSTATNPSIIQVKEKLGV